MRIIRPKSLLIIQTEHNLTLEEILELNLARKKDYLERYNFNDTIHQIDKKFSWWR